jgi:3-phosphoshikimate 1-carboxyvinyltransferase
MLRLFGARLSRQGRLIRVRGGSMLKSPGTIVIPGDVSSASFFLVAAALLPGSRLVIRTVSLNPTRTGILDVLRRMGCRIKVTKKSAGLGGQGEPFGDIAVQAGALKAVTIPRSRIPFLIDELPIIMVAACFASGKTTLKGVEELRVKETDRIRSMTDNLSRMGGRIEVVRRNGSEDIIIHGSGRLSGAAVKSYGDHRTAMAMVVAGLAASGRTAIDDIGCISKSFPDFLQVLKSVIVR